MYTLAPDTNIIGNRVVYGNQNQSRHMSFFMFFTRYWYAEYIWELSRILISTWCVSRLWQRENNSNDVAYLDYLTKTLEMLLELSWITSRFLLVFHSSLAYRQVLTCFLQEKSSEFHKKTNKWQCKTKQKSNKQINRELYVPTPAFRVSRRQTYRRTLALSEYSHHQYLCLLGVVPTNTYYRSKNTENPKLPSRIVS